jgi:hypothetical protein
MKNMPAGSDRFGMSVCISTRVDSADRTEISDIPPIALAQLEDGDPPKRFDSSPSACQNSFSRHLRDVIEIEFPLNNM